MVETPTPLAAVTSAQRWRDAFLKEAAPYRVRARVVGFVPIPGAPGHLLCTLRVGERTFPNLYCPAPPPTMARGQKVEAVLFVAAACCTIPEIPEPYVRAPSDEPERFTAAGKVVAALSHGRFVMDVGLPLVVAVYEGSQARHVSAGDWLELTAIPPTHAYILPAGEPDPTS